jgi:hypothetical protein
MTQIAPPPGRSASPDAKMTPMPAQESIQVTPQGALALGGPGTPVRRISPAGWIGLGGLLVCGLMISLSAAHTQLLLPRSLKPGPGWLSGVFGRVGVNIGLAGIIVALALMFVSYTLALGAAKSLSTRAVLISIAVLNGLVLLAPPLLSTDLFSYIAYGRLGAMYGISPYLHGPNVISFDPVYSFVGQQWTHTPTAYGPLFTALSYPLAGLGIPANVFAYKLIAALSCLAIVWLVWHAARLRGTNQVEAVALVGLNPVIVVYGVGGGHNDLLMLALLVGGVYVLLRQQAGTGGAMIVAATAVKLTAGMLLPFALAANTGRRMARRADRQRLLAGAAASALVCGLFGLLLFGSGPLQLLSTLTGIQGEGGSHSIPGFILMVVGLSSLSTTVAGILHVLYAMYLAWLLHRVWIDKLDWITAAGWAFVGLLLTAGLIMPWYIAWLIPLAALSHDRRLWTTAMVLTCLGLTSL